ncbi:16S rRNA (guanine(527)-N(7))-methyltransferase RsmG [Psychrobacter pygoscelis]|uniref:16S rRNA (guanine(527)-N(7))-methyltransferase RsmG n=1 Tax=Psychrobacter pygoscelis TaxID=2488563 RepID=UPI00103FA655|nr:16S rRNA (guanine(527)-N(7))-methyltransferase RsmG [Psychrobacter pygoscelis]
MSTENIVDLTDPTGIVKINNVLPKLADQLNHAVDELGLALSEAQLRALLLYLDKLLLWNKAYNLTAITQPVEALTKHIVDCLAVLPHLPSGSLLDIGTGAGLPAVIIAICQPERQCSALDSNQKKIRFIRQVVSELKLANVRPIASRIEAHNETYEVVTSRAFASLTDFVTLAEPRMQSQGQLCAMKGRPPEPDELAQLQARWQIEVLPLMVPKLNESRNLVNLRLNNL